MIFRGLQLSLLWSVVTVLFSPTSDSSGLAFANDSIEQTPTNSASAENDRSDDTIQVKKIRFSVSLSDGTQHMMAGFLFWDPTKK